MPAGNTYEAIATTTVSGTSTTSVSFSSIPSTYTDLVIVVNAGTSSATDFRLRYNSDTNTNYSLTLLRGDGSSASSVRISNQSFADLSSYATPDSSLSTINLLHVMNYSNTTTYKTTLAKSTRASGGVDVWAILYRSTSAINNIEIYRSGTPYILAGSTFSLYGIAAA